MLRFFVPPELLVGEEISLPEEVVHHLGTVLRRPTGEEVLLLDGLGKICRCRIDQLAKRAGSAHILESRQETEAAFSLTLLQALPKGDKFDLILQKGTELGVTAFAPVTTERSLPPLPADREASRRQRWQRIISEAARQSRRPILPFLSPPRPLATALGTCREELRLFFWEGESRPLATILPATPPAGAAILIGPEGGFSAAEAVAIQAAGFQPVHLGPRILRTETAGFTAAAILQFLFGNLQLPPPRE